MRLLQTRCAKRMEFRYALPTYRKALMTSSWTTWNTTELYERNSPVRRIQEKPEGDSGRLKKRELERDLGGHQGPACG
nr:uncharacterized protein LOC112985116 [Dromaius novaehollandiae]